MLGVWPGLFCQNYSTQVLADLATLLPYYMPEKYVKCVIPQLKWTFLASIMVDASVTPHLVLGISGHRMTRVGEIRLKNKPYHRRLWEFLWALVKGNVYVYDDTFPVSMPKMADQRIDNILDAFVLRSYFYVMSLWIFLKVCILQIFLFELLSVIRLLSIIPRSFLLNTSFPFARLLFLHRFIT